MSKAIKHHWLWSILNVSLVVLVNLLLLSKRRVLARDKSNSFPPAKLRGDGVNQVIMDNGIVEVALSIPGGSVTCIKYKGIDNLLEFHNKKHLRGYWDVVWSSPRTSNRQDTLDSENMLYRVLAKNDDVIELSFYRAWNNSTNSSFVPLNIDKRFIMQRGSSGFYTYAIFDRPHGWPGFHLISLRVVYKVNGDKFHYMAVSDQRQRVMPTPRDRRSGQKLNYHEAVLLTNPSNSNLKGEVDDKYQYSIENMYNKVHGWISNDPPVGFWMITPNNDFRTCGPTKQGLTSHAGPTILNVFLSDHYAGRDAETKFQHGEPWKKVFGPVFVYFNSAAPKNHTRKLWKNAKAQMFIETENWPYNFTHSDDFPSANKRGSVAGQLLVLDRYLNETYLVGNSAFVGLAVPGDTGSWQKETKGYQFWTRADDYGLFKINNIRPGKYNLYAWVPGIIGDYKYEADVNVKEGTEVNLGQLVYKPPRHGPTLWEIGVPDRKAAEFYVPPPLPNLRNKLYDNLKSESFRQYGLWARYVDFYPKTDLAYTIGVSDYRKDWFYAHVPRNIGNNTFVPTTWQINFDLENVKEDGSYKLQLALAASHLAKLQIRFNNQWSRQPHFSTGRVGWDNAIARHGIHGLYWYFGFVVRGALLRSGRNTIFLTQIEAQSPFQGVMYDYIRFEGPPE